MQTVWSEQRLREGGEKKERQNERKKRKKEKIITNEIGFDMIIALHLHHYPLPTTNPSHKLDSAVATWSVRSTFIEKTFFKMCQNPLKLLPSSA